MPKRYDISLPCTRPERTGRPATCLQSLAEGWIGMQDLCGGCTTRMMAALEWVTGQELRWHPGYRARSAPGADAPPSDLESGAP